MGAVFHNTKYIGQSIVILAAILMLFFVSAKQFLPLTEDVEAQARFFNLGDVYSSAPQLHADLEDGYFSSGETEQYFTSGRSHSDNLNEGYTIEDIVVLTGADSTEPFNDCIYTDQSQSQGLPYNRVGFRLGSWHADINTNPSKVTLCIRATRTQDGQRETFVLGRFFSFAPSGTGNNGRLSEIENISTPKNGRSVVITLKSGAKWSTGSSATQLNDVAAADELNEETLQAFQLHRGRDFTFARTIDGGRGKTFRRGIFSDTRTLTLLLNNIRIDRREVNNNRPVLVFSPTSSTQPIRTGTGSSYTTPLPYQTSTPSLYIPIMNNGSTQNDTTAPSITWYIESNGEEGLQQSGDTELTQTNIDNWEAERESTIYAYINEKGGSGIHSFIHGVSGSNIRCASQEIIQAPISDRGGVTVVYGVLEQTLAFTINERNERACVWVSDYTYNIRAPSTLRFQVGGSSGERSPAIPIDTTPPAPVITATIPDNSRADPNAINPTKVEDDDTDPDVLNNGDWTNVDRITLTLSGATEANRQTYDFDVTTNCEGCSMQSGSGVFDSEAGTISFVLRTGSVSGLKTVSAAYSVNGVLSRVGTFNFGVDKFPPIIVNNFPSVNGLTNENWAIADIAAGVSEDGYAYADNLSFVELRIVTVGGSGYEGYGWEGLVDTAADCSARALPANPAGFTPIGTVDTVILTGTTDFPGRAFTDESDTGKYYCAIVRDRAGNVSTRASDHPIKLDKTAPTIDIPSSGANAKGIDNSWTNEPKIQIDLTDNNLSRYRWGFVDATADCTTTATVGTWTAITDNNYTSTTDDPVLIDDEDHAAAIEANANKYLCVILEDKAGNATKENSTHVFKFDETPPTGTPTNQAAGFYKVGTTLKFNFTALNFNISGDDTDTSGFTLRVGPNDGARTDYDTSDDELVYDSSTKIFTFTVPAGVDDTDGVQYEYTVTDNAGNERSLDTAVSGVIVDTTAPIAPTIDLDTTSDTGAEDDDNITADNTPTFTITNYDTVNDNDTITTSWYVDGTVQTGATGETFTPATALADGTYDITARFTDQATNTTDSTALSVTVDTTAPTAPTIDLDTASDTGVFDTDNITTDNTPTITITNYATVTADDTVTVSWFVDNTKEDDETGSTFTRADDNVLADGNSVFKARFTDQAGNFTDSSGLTVTIDTVVRPAPTLTATIPDNSRADPNAINPTKVEDDDTDPDILTNGAPTNVNEITFSYTNIPSGEGVAQVIDFTRECEGCSRKAGSWITNEDGSGSFVVITGSNPGRKAVSVAYITGAIKSEEAIFHFRLDKKAPTIGTFPSVDGLTNANWATANILPSTGGVRGYTYNDTRFGSGYNIIGWSGFVDATTDCTAAELPANPTGFINIETAARNNAVRTAVGRFPGRNIRTANNNGRYYCVIARDRAGNVATRVSSHPVKLDKTAPSITIPSSGANAKGIDGDWTNEPKIQILITDNNLRRYRWGFVDTTAACTAAATPGSWVTLTDNDYASTSSTQVLIDDEDHAAAIEANANKYVCVIVEDKAGNITPENSTNTFTFDESAPTGAADNPADGLYGEDDELTFDFSDIDYALAGDNTNHNTSFVLKIGDDDGTTDDYDTSSDELEYDTATKIFTFTVPSGLVDSDGVQYEYTVVDEAGNDLNLDTSLSSVFVDTVAPTAPTIDLDTASDTGVIKLPTTSRQTPPQASPLPTTQPLLLLIRSRSRGFVDGTVQANQTGSTFTPATALTDGTYAITARFTDTADNTVDSAALTITIDITGPTAPVDRS